MVGQLELPLEVAAGDAAMQIRARAVTVLFGLSPGDDQKIRLRRDFQFVGAKPGRGQRDAVALGTGLFDVVGR